MVDPLSLFADAGNGLLKPAAQGQLVADTGILEARTLDQGNAFIAIEVTWWWWWRLMAGPVILPNEVLARWAWGVGEQILAIAPSTPAYP